MRTSPRGYVLMIVIVMGVVLASLAGTLLYAVTRDRSEAKLQTSSVRAVYASEAAVATGIEKLRSALEENVSPDLAAVETAAKAAAVTALPGATFPTFSIRYFDATTNTTSATPFGTSTLTTITTGANAGLKAQQTPIQVFAVAQVDKAMASVADAIRVDLIPVFQFAMFFDGDLETQRPAPMTIAGRVHTNGSLYLSNGSEAVNFTGTVSAAGSVVSHLLADSGVTVGSGTNATTFARLSPAGQVAVANDLPRSDAAQKTYLQTTYGVGGGLQDKTTGVTPLSIPLRLTSASTCASGASCGVGRSCVKIRATDATGVCTDDVVSRPKVCGDGVTAASFSQSLAVELIKRPKKDYSNTGTGPYAIGFSRDNTAQTSPYAADYGPRPAQVEDSGAARTSDGSNADADDIFEVAVTRRIPIVTSTPADDDPGAINDRMYWKAHIRIIDGVWYKGQSTTPIFNPELDAPGTANPDPTTDLNHAFARVLRYSWWWDARENRVYCESSDATSNCVTDGSEYQRGGQIRATDFDMAAFMALLERSDARVKLFGSSGTIPSGGIVLYISETYDPRYEDASSKVERAANVRNFLNFPVMHNHLTAANIAALTAAEVLRKNPATAYGAATPATPHELGWFPENIWGRSVTALNMESLTRPVSGAEPKFYANPPPNGGDNGSGCVIPGTDYTSSRRPASRPTSFATARVPPPCTQAGAQPLGPENAVRVIRAHTMPSQGFTLVTDNRLYLHGEVNVRGDSSVTSGGFATSQDVSGKYSFVSDSLTIQSERFDERRRQAAAGATVSNFQSFFRDPTGYDSEAFTRAGIASVADKARALPYSQTASTAGAVANVCAALQADSPFETRINASFLMGDVPSCASTDDSLGNLSGGVNNFPRFVERWTNSVPLMLNGSLVGLFRSERGNARFLSADSNSTGTVRQARSSGPWGIADKDICDYIPPERRWTFDNTLLASVDNLPPGTPRVVATDRLRWVRR